jgi:hypothetical protein
MQHGVIPTLTLQKTLQFAACLQYTWLEGGASQLAACNYWPRVIYTRGQLAACIFYTRPIGRVYLLHASK